jgi:hypothetical protein
MIKLFTIFTLLTFSALAQEASPVALSDGFPEDNRKFNHLKSHFLMSYGFEGLKYETLNDFSGVKSSFKPRDQELWGGRIGVGSQIYLGARIFTTIKMEAYYLGTLFSEVLNGGSKDSEVKFAYTKKTGQIFGGDIVQQFGAIFDFNPRNPFMDEVAYLTFEPYIEVGAGIGYAYNRLNYAYDLGTTDEAYRLRVQDQLLNTRLGVGVNLSSNQGYFLYLRATQNRFKILDRSTSFYKKENGGSETTVAPDLENSMAPITIYALGGGYKF